MKRIATVSATRALLEKHNLRAKKAFGQNFLIDPGIIDKIVCAAGIDEQDMVVEVGPGLGSLTEGLLANAGMVLAYEIDGSLIPILESNFSDRSNFLLKNEDVMKADIPSAIAEAYRSELRPGFIVAANLPYYITTPIMMLFLESDLPWRRMVVMVQREVADRLAAKPGTKDYGAITLAINYRATVKKAFNVPSTVFLPRPNVESAVVVLERLSTPRVEVADERLLFRLIRAGFAQRRKTLLNSLSSVLACEKSELLSVFEGLGIDGTRRGETLSLEEYALLANSPVLQEISRG